MKADRDYSLLIFDWDGTLADSSAKIINCFTEAARAAGMESPDPEAVRFCIGMGLHETFSKLYPGLDPDGIPELVAHYRKFYLFHDRTPVHLFPGVAGGLEKLKQCGYSLAVATGKSREGLRHALKDFDLIDRFEHTRCADQSRSKPDPLMLFDILGFAGKEPDSALMIGDTLYDLHMAARAAMDGWGVGYGAHSADLLEPFSCREVAQDFVELVDVLTGRS